ncbi:MGH1-like glycoside hydrolase domain-containing protein [Oceaniglobus roseus]|uniref:MGH1-like glycoside hydrolase domain-containing protein n=1 Tax=Oceaniglobus roseus TaxID=1737570 RepID=UPI003183E260
MQTDDLDSIARDILRRNDRGTYTIPTSGLYPFQWNWDSAFAAWGFATFDPSRAWTELETLFSAQWDTGMVPHIIFHRDDEGYFPGPGVWGTGTTPPSSGISQPPVAAILARLIHDSAGGTDRLRALYPKMLAWHRWWQRARTVNGTACITHPWESGRDNCPDWDPGMANVDGSNVGPYQRRDTGHVDPSMRPGKEDYDRYLAIVQFGRACGWDQDTILNDGPFLMADPAIHFILMRANRDLAALARTLGEDPAEPEAMAAELEAALPSIWNDHLQAYCARDMKTGTFAESLSSGAALGLLAGVENAAMETKLAAMWDRVAYGIPSNDPAAPSFNARRYWRGPTWPVVNALIAIGLRSAGRHAEETRLRAETAALIRQGGFFEYFDPQDGTACGGDNFTWTAAIWLAWANGANGRD